MAASADAIALRRWRGVLLGVVLALCHRPGFAQARISLAQLASRSNPDFVARFAGKKVAVRGVVSGPAFHFGEYSTLAFQDGSNGGVLKLPLSDPSLDRFSP